MGIVYLLTQGPRQGPPAQKQKLGNGRDLRVTFFLGHSKETGLYLEGENSDVIFWATREGLFPSNFTKHGNSSNHRRFVEKVKDSDCVPPGPIPCVLPPPLRVMSQPLPSQYKDVDVFTVCQAPDQVFSLRVLICLSKQTSKANDFFFCM